MNLIIKKDIEIGTVVAFLKINIERMLAMVLTYLISLIIIGLAIYIAMYIFPIVKSKPKYKR